jgi:hypothetical protein
VKTDGNITHEVSRQWHDELTVVRKVEGEIARRSTASRGRRSSSDRSRREKRIERTPLSLPTDEGRKEVCVCVCVGGGG